MEIGNKLIKKILKSMTDGLTDGRTDGRTPITPKWPPPQVLANAVMVYNSTPNYFLTKTPYYLLMGISMDMFEFTTYFSQ